MKKTLIATLLTGLFSGSLAMAAPVAIVNGVEIDQSVIDDAVSTAQTQLKLKDEDVKAFQERIKKEIVAATVIAQAAQAAGFDKRPEVTGAIEQIKQQAAVTGRDKTQDFIKHWEQVKQYVLVSAYVADLQKNAKVTDKEISAEFSKLVKRYQGTREVQFGGIVTRTKEDAQKALAELRRRKKFEDVAKKYSIAADAKEHGGVTKDFVPELAIQEQAPTLYEALRKLRPGHFTPAAIEHANGTYSILYLKARRPVTLPKLEEVRQQIEQLVRAQAADTYIKDLVAKARIQYV